MIEELGTPDLDLIKQAQQGAGLGAGRFAGVLGQSRRPAENLPRPCRVAFHKQFNTDVLAFFRAQLGDRWVSDADAAVCSLCGRALSRGDARAGCRFPIDPGFRLIDVPADADGPVLKGAMWYPCPEAAVLILTNHGGETS